MHFLVADEICATSEKTEAYDAQVITNLAFQVSIICLRNISAKLDLKWVQLWSQFRGVYGWMKHFLAQKEKVINIQNAGKQKKEIWGLKEERELSYPSQ